LVTVKVEVDAMACQGHGLCYALAPDVIDLDDDGHATMRPGGPEPAADLAARLVASCPELAITATE
jgi:ferredoxin